MPPKAVKPPIAPADQSVEITFDRDYTVVFGTRTLARIEKSFGKPMFELATQFVGGEDDAATKLPPDATPEQRAQAQAQALARRFERAVRTYKMADVLQFIEACIPELKAEPTVEQVAAAWPVLISAFVGAFNRLFSIPEDPSEKKGSPSPSSEPGPSSSSDSAESPSTT